MNYKSLVLIMVVSAGVYFTSCQDVELGDPDLTHTATNSLAFFSMTNASPNAPALDLYIDNIKQGSSVSAGAGQNGYSKIALASNGTFANVNIRSKASTGTIGGVLDKSDLIFRAGNANSNNFQAADSGYYTVIVLDSTTRPKPVRLLNAGFFADTTFFNPLTGKQISVVERKGLSAAEKSKLAPLGTVPLGSSDPGGLRYLIITDQLPLPSTHRFPKLAAGKAAVRFIHASPNAETVTVTVGGTNVNNSASIFTYPMRFPTFNPTVGSRTIATTNFLTVNAGVMDVVVKGTGGATIAQTVGFNFETGGIYTIVLSGNRNDLTKGTVTSLPLSIIKNK